MEDKKFLKDVEYCDNDSHSQFEVLDLAINVI